MLHKECNDNNFVPIVVIVNNDDDNSFLYSLYKSAKRICSKFDENDFILLIHNDVMFFNEKCSLLSFNSSSILDKGVIYVSSYSLVLSPHCKCDCVFVLDVNNESGFFLLICVNTLLISNLG